jgi:plasmid maintenance system antidote protein VapI
MYPNLKLQIWRLGYRQNRLAQMIGIHETLLSKIINGFRAVDPKIRTQIATVLKCDENWLFLQEAASPTITPKESGEPKPSPNAQSSKHAQR